MNVVHSLLTKLIRCVAKPTKTNGTEDVYMFGDILFVFRHLSFVLEDFSQNNLHCIVLWTSESCRIMMNNR